MRYTLFYDNPNKFGFFVVVLFFFLVSLWKFRESLASYFVLFSISLAAGWLVIATESRGNLLAMIFALIIVLTFRSLPIISGLLLGGIIDYCLAEGVGDRSRNISTDGSIIYRLHLWKQPLVLATDFPHGYSREDYSLLIDTVIRPEVETWPKDALFEHLKNSFLFVQMKFGWFAPHPTRGPQALLI